MLHQGQKIPFNQVDPAKSFTYNGRSVSILSDNELVYGTDVTGLLYTPDLDLRDPCYNVSQPYILNATRQSNLPNVDYKNLIALAPWISPECTLSFLHSADTDPLNAFMFYLPNNDTDTPPGGSDPQWNLGDNGQWKQASSYPVFAIPGATGSLLMRASAAYSGNITSVPYGDALLAGGSDARDYVRLFIDISTSPTNNLPSLWIFLLIVLGILLGVIIATSIFMHCLQRRRRTSLRQRVVNGELDLEALGIQRLTVPQHLLDEMPLFEYGSGRVLDEGKARTRQQSSEKVARNINIVGEDTAKAQEAAHSASSSVSKVPTPAARPNFENHINQPTCAICLDDFATPTADSPGSAVRQLPCHHIFHPDCVDNFLRENSSLCPMCKHSALPVGYCPRNITNAMVRRERIIRRMRERADAGEQTDEIYSTRPVGSYYSRVRNRLFIRRSPSARQGHAMAEMTVPAEGPAGSTACPPESAAPSTDGQNRREWARQRALAMLGRRPLVAEQETERPSRWRKVLGGVFPGIA